MECFIGIDLGSTTTKAVIIDRNRNILGSGITNSRSNYDVACKIAREEAFTNARFSLIRGKAKQRGLLNSEGEKALVRLGNEFFVQDFLIQLWNLRDLATERLRNERYATSRLTLQKILREIFEDIEEKAMKDVGGGGRRKSDFFRDLAGAYYQESAERYAREGKIPFELLMSVFDGVIFLVENSMEEKGFAEIMKGLFDRVGFGIFPKERETDWRELIEATASTPFNEAGMIGTGYGRQRLPFPKECIQSEILCHGYGAHHMFGGTATVLDIGGQDTKAIQVDERGVVTSFQMNDRCAAGCGRYLGYIADEMNIGLHELGPLALEAGKCVRINSTCTVFAGAELRDRLALGERREDILLGLHRAIILRAMSLLARSGGIRNEFTFTGGVAKNPAAVKALGQLVYENYGEMQMNIHPDSIFTGALGAALFGLERPAAQMLPTNQVLSRPRES
ncbi:MAG TPA: BadF/BadG/BcrA/BcrD ATPase family protein [Bdellovibrionota bacterium]|nr:BadF/BadG/BcrA/BcrD ATPase family protein [Bdellovibrionota bacterium]